MGVGRVQDTYIHTYLHVGPLRRLRLDQSVKTNGYGWGRRKERGGSLLELYLRWRRRRGCKMEVERRKKDRGVSRYAMWHC